MGEKELSYELTSTRKPLVLPSMEKSDEFKAALNALPPQWIDSFEDCRIILKEIDDISTYNFIQENK